MDKEQIKKEIAEKIIHKYGYAMKGVVVSSMRRILEDTALAALSHPDLIIYNQRVDGFPKELRIYDPERSVIVPRELLEKLKVSARQYRHNNDNSPSITDPDGGFVIAYDREAVEDLINQVQGE